MTTYVALLRAVNVGGRAADRVAALQAAIKGREVVWALGPHVFIVYPDGIGKSRLTAAVIERTLGTRGTWNTVLKLGASI